MGPWQLQNFGIGCRIPSTHPTNPKACAKLRQPSGPPAAGGKAEVHHSKRICLGLFRSGVAGVNPDPWLINPYPFTTIITNIIHTTISIYTSYYYYRCSTQFPAQFSYLKMVVPKISGNFFWLPTVRSIVFCIGATIYPRSSTNVACLKPKSSGFPAWNSTPKP